VQWANSPNFDAVKFQVKVKLVQLDGRGLGHIKDKLELFAINCMRFLDKVIWRGRRFFLCKKKHKKENRCKGKLEQELILYVFFLAHKLEKATLLPGKEHFVCL
jgi:hypothetical protein